MFLFLLLPIGILFPFLQPTNSVELNIDNAPLPGIPDEQFVFSEEAKNIAWDLKVSHFDCAHMTESKMFSLNKVADCKVKPENLRVSEAMVHVYQRSYRTKAKAKACSVKHQLIKFWCGTASHSSMGHASATITQDLLLTKEQSEEAVKNKETITLDQFKAPMKPDISMGVEKIYVINQGGVELESQGRDCDGSGWIYHNSFITFMQELELRVHYRDHKVLNPLGLPLPCDLSEGGCDSTSQDRNAYVWDSPENCIVTKLHTTKARMIQYDDKYFIIAENNTDPDNSLDFKIQINKDAQQVCGKKEKLHTTNFDSLFVTYDGGFDMKTGTARNLKNEIDVVTNYYTFNLDRKGTVMPKSVSFAYDKDGKLIGDEPWSKYGVDIVDYEAHLGAKLDYIMYYSTRQLRHSELTLLQKQCELERTQILTILMLAVENTRLAGYMLTGNRSMFLDTDGSAAWLYRCPKRMSPLRVLERCYDRIPIYYDSKTHFVDPITRQTFEFANEITCDGGHQNVFQLDMDFDDSWYQLLPEPTPHKKPNTFAPMEISRITKFADYSTAGAGMFTQQELEKFWNKIVLHQKSNTVLQKFSQEIVGTSDANSKHSNSFDFGLGDNIYIDRLISPNFFEFNFKKHFGFLTYWIERLGIYFAAFLLIKFVIQIIVTILRALEIHRITGASVSFGKIILSATYQLLFLSILTNLFKSENDLDTENEPGTYHKLYPDLMHHEQITNDQKNGKGPSAPSGPLPPP